MRFILSMLVLFLFVVGVSFVAHFVVRAQEVEGARILSSEYTLPYAGIGPDNPLYPLKEMRDSLWVFFTRDHNKKAELLLLMSDKKIVMAQNLARMEKWDMVVESLRDSESDIKLLITSLDSAKKIGYSPTDDFVRQALQSSDAHLVIMKRIFKESDPRVRAELEEIMKDNVEHYNQLKNSH